MKFREFIKKYKNKYEDEILFPCGNYKWAINYITDLIQCKFSNQKFKQLFLFFIMSFKIFITLNKSEV